MNAMLAQILPFLLIFVVFYFLLIRPQQKRQRERMAMLNSLKKDDKVITIGGLHGVVAALDENTVTLRVNENTKLTFERSAINSVKKD
jgi:preprotein translocase subunit YajC